MEELVYGASLVSGAYVFVQLLRSMVISIDWRGRPRRQPPLFEGARDFWFRGVDADELKLSETAPDQRAVRVRGLLSSFGPYLPTHPLNKPAFSARGWSSRELFEDHLARRRFITDGPMADNYDYLDTWMYGDTVIRPGQIGHYVYAGLYDVYGYSTESVPVLLDTRVDSRLFHENPEWNVLGCMLVELQGVLKPMDDYVGALIRHNLLPPWDYDKRPSFFIHVSSEIAISKVTKLERRPRIFYGTAFGWSKGLRQYGAEYFNFAHPAEFSAGVKELHERLDARLDDRGLHLYWDVCQLSGELPEGNQIIQEQLRRLLT